MTKTKARGHRTAKALVLFSVISFGASGTAFAQGGMADLRALPMLVSSAAGKGSASFDWLPKGKRLTSAVATAPVKPKVSGRTTLGKGRYVCSPAGFGRRSRCHSR
jgi:hypothetical protein